MPKIMNVHSGLAAVLLLAMMNFSIAADLQDVTDPQTRNSEDPTLQALVFRLFTRDMFSAGLDQLSEKQMRMFLGSASVNASQQNELLVYLQSTWMDIEQEADHVRREVLCRELKDSSESAEVMSSAMNIANALEVAIYAKHLLLREAELLISKDISLRRLLEDYPAPREQLLKNYRRRVNGSYAQPDLEISRFCESAWEYSLYFRQPDGTNKHYKIEL